MRELTAPRSTPARERTLADLEGRRWDVLVVGGGISGTAVARDAALRGLNTALVEQSDLAYGTSSRSSRLVHGGLRYLAQHDFALVREGLVERRRLLDHAPGLVRPVEFLYPVYATDPDPLWKVNLGVGLYELLAVGHGLGGKRLLSKQDVRRAVPGLRDEGLRGGVLYRDAATHDTRLTLAVASSARDAGAAIVARCRALELVERSGRVTGARVEDRIAGRSLQVRARAVILCCGPWQNLYGPARVRLHTARGTHLSLPFDRLPLSAFVAVRSPEDGRLTFAMPMGGYTVLGTTDRFDPSAPGSVEPTPEETGYLLGMAEHAFPETDLAPGDVVGTWAGLRPLVSAEEKGSADDLSREHRIVAGPPGLWVLTGGKLTTHRAMAEECLDVVAPYVARGGRHAGECRTRELPLSAGALGAGRRRLEDLGVEAARIEELSGLYGGGLEHLASVLARLQPTSPCPPELVLEAQIEVAVGEEWALTLDDLLLRRSGPGPLDLRACWRLAPRAARSMAELLDWSPEEERRQVEAFRAGVERDLHAAGLPAPDDASVRPDPA